MVMSKAFVHVTNSENGKKNNQEILHILGLSYLYENMGDNTRTPGKEFIYQGIDTEGHNNNNNKNKS